MLIATGVAVAGCASFGADRPHAAPLQDPTSTISIDDIGRGANEVWVWRSSGVPKQVLIFLHGQGDLSPVDYNAWFGYLALRDTAVIFPRYENNTVGSSGSETLRALEAGITAGFSNIRHGSYGRFGMVSAATYHRGPLLVAGFGYGATLAFQVASHADAWGLGTPYAVDSIFPAAGSIAGVSAPTIAPATRVLIQSDKRDPTVVVSAESLLRSLKEHSRKSLSIVTSTGRLTDGLRAPLQTSVAEDAFWPPLDNLLSASIGGAEPG
jgi:hypothetical protein